MGVGWVSDGWYLALVRAKHPAPAGRVRVRARVRARARARVRARGVFPQAEPQCINTMGYTPIWPYDHVLYPYMAI